MPLGQSPQHQHRPEGVQGAKGNEEDGKGKLVKSRRAAAAIPLLGSTTQVKCISEQAESVE